MHFGAYTTLLREAEEFLYIQITQSVDLHACEM